MSQSSTSSVSESKQRLGEDANASKTLRSSSDSSVGWNPNWDDDDDVGKDKVDNGVAGDNHSYGNDRIGEEEGGKTSEEGRGGADDKINPDTFTEEHVRRGKRKRGRSSVSSHPSAASSHHSPQLKKERSNSRISSASSMGWNPDWNADDDDDSDTADKSGGAENGGSSNDACSNVGNRSVESMDHDDSEESDEGNKASGHSPQLPKLIDVHIPAPPNEKESLGPKVEDVTQSTSDELPSTLKLESYPSDDDMDHPLELKPPKSVRYQLLGAPALLYRHASSYTDTSMRPSTLTPQQQSLALHLQKHPLSDVLLDEQTLEQKQRQKWRSRFRKRRKNNPAVSHLSPTFMPQTPRPWGCSNDWEMMNEIQATTPLLNVPDENDGDIAIDNARREAELNTADMIQRLHRANRAKLRWFWGDVDVGGDVEAWDADDERIEKGFPDPAASNTRITSTELFPRRRSQRILLKNIRSIAKSKDESQQETSSKCSKSTEGFSRKGHITGYNLFSSEYIRQLKESNDGNSVAGSTVAMAAKAWKKMSAKEKLEYEKRADVQNNELTPIDKGDGMNVPRVVGVLKHRRDGTRSGSFNHRDRKANTVEADDGIGFDSSIRPKKMYSLPMQHTPTRKGRRRFLRKVLWQERLKWLEWKLERWDRYDKEREARRDILRDYYMERDMEKLVKVWSKEESKQGKKKKKSDKKKKGGDTDSVAKHDDENRDGKVKHSSPSLLIPTSAPLFPLSLLSQKMLPSSSHTGLLEKESTKPEIPHSSDKSSSSASSALCMSSSSSSSSSNSSLTFSSSASSSSSSFCSYHSSESSFDSWERALALEVDELESSDDSSDDGSSKEEGERERMHLLSIGLDLDDRKAGRDECCTDARGNSDELIHYFDKAASHNEMESRRASLLKQKQERQFYSINDLVTCVKNWKRQVEREKYGKTPYVQSGKESKEPAHLLNRLGTAMKEEQDELAFDSSCNVDATFDQHNERKMDSFYKKHSKYARMQSDSCSDYFAPFLLQDMETYSGFQSGNIAVQRRNTNTDDMKSNIWGKREEQCSSNEKAFGEEEGFVEENHPKLVTTNKDVQNIEQRIKLDDNMGNDNQHGTSFAAASVADEGGMSQSIGHEDEMQSDVKPIDEGTSLLQECNKKYKVSLDVDGPSGYGNCLLVIECSCVFCRRNDNGSNGSLIGRRDGTGGKGFSFPSATPSNFLVHPSGELLSCVTISYLRLPRDRSDIGRKSGCRVDVGRKILQISQCSDSFLVIRTSHYCSIIHLKPKQPKPTSVKSQDKECSTIFDMSEKTRIDLCAPVRSVHQTFVPLFVASPRITSTEFVMPSFAIVGRNSSGDSNMIHHVTIGRKKPAIKVHSFSSLLSNVSMIEFDSCNILRLWALALSRDLPKLSRGFFKKRTGILTGYGHSLFSIDLRTDSASKVWSPSHAEFTSEGLHSIDGLMSDRVESHIVWVSSSSACKVWALDVRYKSAKIIVSWSLPSLCNDLGAVCNVTGIHGAGTLMSQPQAALLAESNARVMFSLRKDPGTFALGVHQFPTSQPRFQTHPLESAGFIDLSPSCIARSAAFPLPDVSDEVFNVGIVTIRHSSRTALLNRDLLGFETPPAYVTYAITMTSMGDIYCHSLVECNAMDEPSAKRFPGLPVGAVSIPVSNLNSEHLTSRKEISTGIKISLTNQFPIPSSAITPYIIMSKAESSNFGTLDTKSLKTFMSQPSVESVENERDGRDLGGGDSSRDKCPQSMYTLLESCAKTKEENAASLRRLKLFRVAHHKADEDYFASSYHMSSNKLNAKKSSESWNQLNHSSSKFGFSLPRGKERELNRHIKQPLRIHPCTTSLPSHHMLIVKNDIEKKTSFKDVEPESNHGKIEEITSDLVKALKEDYFCGRWKRNDEGHNRLKSEWSVSSSNSGSIGSMS